MRVLAGVRKAGRNLGDPFRKVETPVHERARWQTPRSDVSSGGSRLSGHTKRLRFRGRPAQTRRDPPPRVVEALPTGLARIRLSTRFLSPPKLCRLWWLTCQRLFRSV